MASSATTCRYCQFYTADRRWAGECQLLHVTVGSDWPACRSSHQLFSEAGSAVPAINSPSAIALSEAEWGMEATAAPQHVEVA